MSALFDDPGMKGKPVRETDEIYVNEDYIQKKNPRQTKPLPAIILDAESNGGDQKHANFQELLKSDETMGVSVSFTDAPPLRNDYVAFYSVKDVLKGDRYPIGVTTDAVAQPRDKDCIIEYDNDLYLIGDHAKR